VWSHWTAIAPPSPTHQQCNANLALSSTIPQPLPLRWHCCTIRCFSVRCNIQAGSIKATHGNQHREQHFHSDSTALTTFRPRAPLIYHQQCAVQITLAGSPVECAAADRSALRAPSMLLRSTENAVATGSSAVEIVVGQDCASLMVHNLDCA
jgi:hypothetical protein